MIQNPIKFDTCDTREELDRLLQTFFGDRHFYLEVGAGDVISDSGGYHAALRSARFKSNNREGRMVIELMRRCYPARMIRFAGLEKFNSKWWVAVVDLVDPTNVIGVSGLERVKDTHRLLMSGWTNKTHGTTATYFIVTNTDRPKMLKNIEAQFKARVEEKQAKGYELVWGLEPDEEYEDVLDLKPPADLLPVIPGLGKPKPRKKEEVLTVEPPATPAPPKPKSPTATPAASAPPKKEKKKDKPKKKEAPKKKPMKKKKVDKQAEALKEKMRKRRRASEW